MAPQALAAYVCAAAEQRRWLLPRRRDRRLLVRNGTLIHAIDTDVVKLYTSLWETAPHTEHRREGYRARARHVKAVRLTGSVLIAQDAVAQRERKKQTLDWLREPMVEKNSVMCYDQERFRLLKDIVEERIR